MILEVKGHPDFELAKKAVEALGDKAEEKLNTHLCHHLAPSIIPVIGVPDTDILIATSLGKSLDMVIDKANQLILRPDEVITAQINLNPPDLERSAFKQVGKPWGVWIHRYFWVMSLKDMEKRGYKIYWTEIEKVCPDIMEIELDLNRDSYDPWIEEGKRLKLANFRDFEYLREILKMEKKKA